MKTLIKTFSLIGIIIVPTINVVSCFSPGNDPFEYIPYKINGSYSNLEKTNLVRFKEPNVKIDYSPLTIEALKRFGSDKFDSPKYEHLREQFISEIDFYKHFSNSPFLSYSEAINNLKFNIPFEFENFNKEKQQLLQIIRIQNYSSQPEFKNDQVYFNKITYCKYNFEYSDNIIGKYVATNQCKNVEIYLNNITQEKLIETIKDIEEFWN